MKDIAKTVLSSPSVFATAVANEETVAEWELGIPPDEKIFRKSSRRSLTNSTATFAKEAQNQPRIEHTKA